MSDKPKPLTFADLAAAARRAREMPSVHCYRPILSCELCRCPACLLDLADADAEAADEEANT